MAQHLTTSQEICCALEALPEGKIANVLAEMDESIEDEVPNLFVGLFYQFSI